MALLVTTDNRPIFLSAVQANLLWRIHTGERKGSPATRAKVNKIQRWYLNRATAPASYLKRHPDTVEPEKPKEPVQARLPYVDD